MSKHLQDLLRNINFQYKVICSDIGDSNPSISGISYNSKSVQAGDIFVCTVGENFDSHHFVYDAVKNGASAVLAQKPIDIIPVPVIMVEDTSIAMALFSNLLYDQPSINIRLLGVTGTNGKTTVTHLVEKIFEKNGCPCGLIGTLGNRLTSSDSYAESKHTTPQAPDLQKYLGEMVKRGFKYAAMEVSSHSLELNRVMGCDFSVAALTNVTQDHLDFHVTMEQYTKAKMKLFRALNSSKAQNKTAILNMDDPSIADFMKILGQDIKKLTYSIDNPSDIMAKNIVYTGNGTEFDCITPYGNAYIKLNLRGKFSVYNALTAISIALAEGIPLSVINEALAAVENVPGRFESVSSNPLVIVDYAHTPDGLSNILLAAKNLVPAGGKLITVFGCGGDRDPTKRPQMGRIAEELSDAIYVTSDNPRSEDPQQILTDILTGIRSLNSGRVKVEIDRYTAIECAIKESSIKDVIVVAGKGHEDYQILADKTIHFDDREVVREIMQKWKASTGCKTA